MNASVLSNETASTRSATEGGLPGSSPINEQEQCLLVARRVLDLEIQALERLHHTLDARFYHAVCLLEQSQSQQKGRVVVTGMGKSGHVGRKIAATFSSTGTPAYFMHPAEGSHGDLGLLTPHDVVLAISNSGETPELLSLLPTIERLGVPILSLTGRAESTLGKRSAVVLEISVPKEACPMNLAPTTSTTLTLALGDALAVALLERNGFTPDDFALFHPAGTLGKQLLLKVGTLMQTGAALPLNRCSDTVLEALVEMSSKGLGLTLVLDAEQRLEGLLTDGDIRRALQRHPDLLTLPLAQCLTRNPKTIEPTALAVKALRLMETSKITALVVEDPATRTVLGVLHLHELLRAGLH
jgi:arabinose-5-phosphate isomerase